MQALKTYRVTATGFFGRERTLLAVEIQASSKAAAVNQVRKRDNRDYFDRHDYEAGTLRWKAEDLS